MSSHFRSPACLVLSYGLLAIGLVPAEAAGIGVQLTVHAQSIPRAVAGMHGPHLGVDAQAPSRLAPDRRGIQRDGTGETAATRSLK